MAVEILVPLSFMAMVFGIVYVMRSARHREVLSAIEKGMDPGSLNLGYKKKKSSLRDGALLVGVSLGLLSGYFLTTISNIEEPLAYFAMAFLGGGIALLIAHSVENKYDRENPNTEL